MIGLPSPRGAAVALSAAAALALLASVPAPAQHAHHHGGSTGAAAGDTARWTQADADFMAAMIGHHSQAVLMAGWAPSHGASRSVQNLAARIVNAQHDEIRIMQVWLRDRGQPVPEARPTNVMVMTMDGMRHEMMMPGALTDAQLAELDAARGAAFDELFLRYMIQHHRGAVSMVTDLFNTYGAGQDEAVFKFASDVNVDQTTEIARMQRMLADVMFGAPAP